MHLSSITGRLSVSRLLIALSVATSAAVQAEQALQLDTIVVTGTRTEKRLADTPVRTELVSRREIEQQHARDVKEALEVVPGLLIRPIHGKSGYEVWMQGLDSDRVKVLIDGEPVASSTGSSVDVTQIDALNIERIEVIKGASSALYGSSAMGGVVNVVPRKNPDGTHWELKQEAGSYGSDNFSRQHSEATHLLTAFRGSYRDVGRFISVGMTRRQSDGFDATPNSWSSQGPKGTRNNLDFRVGLTPRPALRLELFGNRYREDLITRTQSNAGGKLIQQIKDESTRRRRTGSKISWSHGDGTYSWRFLNEDFENFTAQDVLATPEQENPRWARHDNFNTAFDMSWMSFDDHLLSGGFEWKESSLRQTKDGVDEVPAGTGSHSVELYIQDDIFVSDQLELVPGIRTQRDSDFGYYSAPKINLRYDFLSSGAWESFIRSSIGLGYRVPNLKERHYVFDHSHLGYMVVGNSQLGPEKSKSYQLGLGFVRDARSSSQSHLDINFFYNDIEALIETAFNEHMTAERGDGVSIFSYLNIDQAKTYGSELVFTQDFEAPLSLSLAYTHTRAKDKTSGRHLPNRPEHQIKHTLRYESDNRRFSATLNHIYLSKEYIDLENQRVSPSSHLFDMKTSYQLTDHLALYAGIDNLTDVQRDFTDPDDQRSIAGRFIYLGLTLSSD